MMGHYKYEGRTLKRAANLCLYGISVSGSVYLAVDYAYADSARGIFYFLSPEIRFYLFVLLWVVVVGFAYAASRRILSGPRIDGEIRIQEGLLRMQVQRGNRLELVELDIRELMFVENDDERMCIASSKGKYTFNSKGFVSKDTYQQFRMEMTCEKYKK